MDRVTEFVEQCRRVINADQRWHAIGAGHEVVIVRCKHDVILAAQCMLAAIGGHPRARTLAGAREIVEVEQANNLAIALNLKCPHLGFEHRDCARVFGEAHAI